MIKLSHNEMETHKEAITVHAFNDELIKISAYQILGPDVDLNNLTPEQMEKLAKWKFPLLKGLGRAARGVVEGTKKGVEYLGGKAKQTAQGIGTIAKGMGQVAGGTLGIGVDAAKAGAGAVKNTVEGGVDAAKEGWQAGAPKVEAPKDGAAPVTDAKPAPPVTDAKPADKKDVKPALPKVTDEKQTKGPVPPKTNIKPAETPGKETAPPAPEKMQKQKAQTFGQAFASNRKAGKKTFDWKGKSYTTEMA